MRRLFGGTHRVPLQHTPQEPDQHFGCRAAGLEHLGVAQRSDSQPRSPVGQTGEPGHLQAEGPGLDGLQDRRHPHGIRPEQTQHPHFGRCLVLRPEKTRVNPFPERQPLGPGCIRKPLSEASGIDLSHVHKMRPSHQRRGARKIEVIRNHHPRARVKTRV